MVVGRQKTADEIANNRRRKDAASDLAGCRCLTPSITTHHPSYSLCNLPLTSPRLPPLLTHPPTLHHPTVHLSPLHSRSRCAPPLFSLPLHPHSLFFSEPPAVPPSPSSTIISLSPSLSPVLYHSLPSVPPSSKAFRLCLIYAWPPYPHTLHPPPSTHPPFPISAGGCGPASP